VSGYFDVLGVLLPGIYLRSKYVCRGSGGVPIGGLTAGSEDTLYLSR